MRLFILFSIVELIGIMNFLTKGNEPCFQFQTFDGRSYSNANQIDSLLKLSVVMQDGKRVLRVSFNALEGNDGQMTIYNEKNEKIKVANFELIRSPFYASVDISEMVPGTYSVKLKTSVGVHTQKLILQ